MARGRKPKALSDLAFESMPIDLVAQEEYEQENESAQKQDEEDDTKEIDFDTINFERADDSYDASEWN